MLPKDLRERQKQALSRVRTPLPRISSKRETPSSFLWLRKHQKKKQHKKERYEKRIHPSEYHVDVKKISALEFHSRNHEKSVDELLHILYEAEEEDQVEYSRSEARLRYKRTKKHWKQVRAHVHQMSEKDPVSKVIWAFRNRNDDESMKCDRDDSVASEVCSLLLNEMKQQGKNETYCGLLDILFQSIYLDWSTQVSKERKKWGSIRLHVDAMSSRSSEDSTAFENAMQHFRQQNKSRLLRLRRSRRPESTKQRMEKVNGGGGEEEPESSSSSLLENRNQERSISGVKINTYQTSARQRFVHAFFRPWRWGHEILGLPGLRVPTNESESIMNKRTTRVMQWRRYCQREVDRGAVAPPPAFEEGDVEFRRLHTYKTYGKVMVRTKMMALLRRRKQFLNLFGATTRFDEMTQKKQHVYEYAIRKWQTTFLTYVFNAWRSYCITKRKERHSQRVLGEWEKKHCILRYKRRVFLFWRRATHLKRHIKTKMRLDKAIKRQRSLEYDIDVLQSKIKKLSKHVEKFEEFENYVNVKRDALELLSKQAITYTEDQAKRMACAVALAASSAAKAVAMSANQEADRAHHVISSMSVLHEGMRGLIRTMLQKLLRVDDVETFTNDLMNSLRHRAQKIRTIFDHYARCDMQKHGDVSHMSNRQIMLLIHDSCLVRESFNDDEDSSTSTALAGIVQLCLQQALNDSKQFGKITTITFVLFLIRAGHAKYIKFSNRESDITSAFERVIDKDVYPHVKRFDAESFRTRLFGSTTIMNMVIQRKRDLNGVFANYTDRGEGKNNTSMRMTFPQFCGFVTDLCKPFLGSQRALLSVSSGKKKNISSRNGEKKSNKIMRTMSLLHEDVMGSTMRQQIAKNLLRSGYVGVIFASVQHSQSVISLSKMRDMKRGSVIQRDMEKVVGEQEKEGNKINFIEFLEAIAMLSELLYPNPYNVLSVNMKQFLNEHLFQNCTIKSNAPDFSLKGAFARAEREHAQYIATLQDHNMCNLYAKIRDEKIQKMGLVAHAEFSGNGVHAMLMNDDKKTQGRAEHIIGSKVDMKHGNHHTLLV